MGRKKKETDAPESAGAVEELIEAASDTTDDAPEFDAADAASDALDAARDDEPTPNEPSAPTTDKPRRGRPRGATRKGANDPELPKTKKDLQAYAERLRAERDDARAQVENAASVSHEEAIANLSMSLAAGGQMIGQFMAMRRGPHWRLSQEESDAMGQAWAICLAPHAEVIGTSLPWLVAIGVTYNIFAGRVAVDAAEEGEVTAIAKAP